MKAECASLGCETEGRTCAVHGYEHAKQVQYVEPQEGQIFSSHYLRNRSTSDIGVLGNTGVL